MVTFNFMYDIYIYIYNTIDAERHIVLPRKRARRTARWVRARAPGVAAPVAAACYKSI